MNFRFDLPHKEAIKFFQSKGYKITFDYRDMMKEAHDRSFTVAKMADLDLLKDVHAAILKAQKEGTTFRDFKNQLIPILQAKGWWGRKDMIDPKTGETKEVQLGSTRRLKTIFQTNMHTAYDAAHWQQIQDNKDDFPYLMYDAVDDDRTRDEHAEWDGLVLKVDDPWWNTHYPKNGWNCRCSVIAMNDRMLARQGKESPDKAPNNGTYLWKNPRTGEEESIPNGVDPGWNYAPGASLTDQANAIFDEKAADTEKEMGLKPDFIHRSGDLDSGVVNSRSETSEEDSVFQETRAKDLGVDADYQESTEAGALMNDAMGKILSKKYSVPASVKVNKDFFESEDAKGAMAAYDAKSDTIYLNSNVNWKTASEIVKEEADNKFWSSSNRLQIPFHELGHVNHRKNNERLFRNLPDYHPDIAKKDLTGLIGEYAMEGPKELVAEVLAKYWAGEKIPEIVKKWYSFYGGPPLK